MSYQSTVNEIRAAAITALNGTGRFDHGRHIDLSQKFSGDYPFIFLYPITVTPADSPDFIDKNNLLIGFWMQDSPESSTIQREQIIAHMDVLSTAFMIVLADDSMVRVTNVRKEPQYGMYAGTLSGFAIQLTYQNFTPC